MEEAVIDQKNGKKKKKCKSKADSSSKATPMNTANILLDGIETQVNLGTNLSFGLGEDSESDGSIWGLLGCKYVTFAVCSYDRKSAVI